MNPPLRRTSEGLVISGNRVTFWVGILTLVGLLIGGITGVVRALAPSREEYVQQETKLSTHMHDDSMTHREIMAHDAFQDSVITRQGRDNHELGCYNAGYPPALCGDVQIPRKR